jgi:hypothetical protein
MTLAAIWQDSDASEWFFLLAAVAFFVEAILVVVARRPARHTPEGTTRPVVYSFTGFFLAVGSILLALGLLAL